MEPWPFEENKGRNFARRAGDVTPGKFAALSAVTGGRHTPPDKEFSLGGMVAFVTETRGGLLGWYCYFSNYLAGVVDYKNAQKRAGWTSR